MTRGDRRVAAALFAALAALFWAGRARTFGMGDSPQHVLAALTWSVPHPPGYPLQTALGWLWSRLPWGEPAAAVNGLSGIFSAGAAAFLFLLLRRSGARREAALAGAALMALSPLFWYYSLVAEVRGLNDLLALSAAYFAASWSRDGDPLSLRAFAVLFGLGLSHHPTYVFLVPAYAAWLSARRPSPRQAAEAAALVALGLAGPYLMLGVRLSYGAPVYNLFEVRGWSDLWPLFSRRHLGGPLRMAGGAPLLGARAFDLAAFKTHAGWLLSSIMTHGGPVATGLAAVGAAASWKKDRRDLVAWSLWLAAAAGLFLVFSSQQMPVGVDPAYARAVAIRFHLLPLTAVFALAGFGAEALAARARPGAVRVLLAAVLLVPILRHPLSLAKENPLRDHVRAMIRDSAPGDFIVLGGDDTIFAALEMSLVSGEGSDRVFLCPTMFSFPPYLRRLAATYPGVVLPPAGPGGLTTDWALWKRLNPGRAVLAEPSLLGPVLADFPLSVPQGGLIRVETRAVTPGPSAELEPLPPLREWTQEVYLLRSREILADWLRGRR